MYSFIHSFSSAYIGAVTILGSVDTTVNKQKALPSRRQDNTHNNNNLLFHGLLLFNVIINSKHINQEA